MTQIKDEDIIILENENNNLDNKIPSTEESIIDFDINNLNIDDLKINFESDKHEQTQVKQEETIKVDNNFNLDFSNISFGEETIKKDDDLKHIPKEDNNNPKNNDKTLEIEDNSAIEMTNYSNIGDINSILSETIEKFNARQEVILKTIKEKEELISEIENEIKTLNERKEKEEQEKSFLTKEQNKIEQNKKEVEKMKLEK